jgi:hypothetical protein
MGQADGDRFPIVTAALALAFSLSCRVDEPLLPTGSTGSDSSSNPGSSNPSIPGNPAGSQLSAPIIADPLSGSTVSETQPTLTVLNSARSGGSAPTYLFQVSTESSFTSLVAQSSQVPEGTGGSTAWKVERALTAGPHYWRVQARSASVESSFSATATFTVGTTGGPTTPPPTPPPSSGTILSDPLTGASLGEVSGGQFTSGGWRVTSPADYIRYEVPTLSSGWVEFSTSGLRETNAADDQFMLFGMWDPSAGPYRENDFRVNLQKLHPPHNRPYLRVRWISNGEQHDEGSNFNAWDPSKNYRWRIEWGPEGGGNVARVVLDGDELITVHYNRTYAPDVHFIELGIAERGESVVGAKYSNVRIGR